MSEYRHPYKDAGFVLSELVDFDVLCEKAGFEGVNMELATAVLEEAGKLGSEVLAPLNWSGDQNGASLGDSGVQETPGFGEVYRDFAEAGWLSLAAEEAYGGQGLPNVLSTAVNEIWQSANLSFALCPLLSQGAMEALSHHGSDELKAAFLPNMVSGEWTGTMNLTEPDAGSDLAAIASKAEPEGDHYRVTGQKIFITWGDHQMTNNIIHLVLARLPDAPPGVKGISLFVVPKFLLDGEGNPADRNSVECLSLEHKLGIHASPTCVMGFDKAVGYLVGEPHKGLMYMFTMMNNARQAVGLQGLGVSEHAYQHALQYAKDRLQGTQRDGSRIPIIEHPDVRRMLMTMKSGTEAMRAVALVAAAELDWVRRSACENAESRNAVAELWTPIVKGWLTEFAQEITSLGVQIHGGMGFIEETGAAQFYRDARILPIYEGTTGIQALDFVGRKTLANGGSAVTDLLTDIETDLRVAKASGLFNEAIAGLMDEAVADAKLSVATLLGSQESDAQLPATAAVNYLMQFGFLCGAWLLAKSAVKAKALMDAGDSDTEFLQGKVVTARFFCEHLLPRAAAFASALQAGSESTMALNTDQF